jgi:hypothetical protein
MNSEIDRDVSKSLKYGLPSFVVILWSISIWAIPFFKGEPESVGEFGEMFGSLDSLFAGLAFAGLIIAIAYQRLELQTQREELILQRKELHTSNIELEKQREQLESQSKTLIKQSFENSFFNILELHNSILQEIIYNSNKGRHAISSLNNNISAYYNRESLFTTEVTNLRFQFEQEHNHLPNDNEMEKIEFKVLQGIFSNLLESHMNIIGHYFRNLYHLVRYVDNADHYVENKYDYIKIIRAQLSSDELCLLFYNCLTEKGKKFKSLVEDYSLLKNMDENLLCSKEHTKHFKPKAFGLAP